MQVIKAKPEFIAQLMDMGFSKSQCKAALKKNNNNIERCLDQLLDNGDQFIGIENSDDSADEIVQRREEEKQSDVIRQRPAQVGTNVVIGAVSSGIVPDISNPLGRIRNPNMMP